MSRGPSALAAFYLLRERPAGEPDGALGQTARPALFGGFKDMTRVRYDYPLVLTDKAPGNACVQSLSEIINQVLQDIAPTGNEGEQIRQQVLGLERHIKQLVSSGVRGTLASVWETAQQEILTSAGQPGQQQLRKTLTRAQQHLDSFGSAELVDCDVHLPARMLSHLWQSCQAEMAGRLRARIDGLVQNLTDILKVDYLHTDKARSGKNLRQSVGTSDQQEFDFQAMARVLESAPVGEPLPERRVNRIQAAIKTLRSQRFVATEHSSGRKGRNKDNFQFEFNDCGKALAAYRSRLQDMAAVVKAISIAELEIDNRYDESIHTAYFKHFDDLSLGPEDLAMFPSYLVCLRDMNESTSSQAAVLEILGSGLPFKIMAQTDDAIGDLPATTGRFPFAGRGRQLASMALGLNKVFVLQSASASLYRMRASLMDGMANHRTALFSIYSGGSGDTPAANPYLRAAAATESRVFPSYVFNPDSGDNWAARFSLEANPQLHRDWPVHPLQFEDPEHQRLSEDCAFTLVDFVAGDKRFAGHFAPVSADAWHDGILPVAEFLELGLANGEDHLPYVWLLDDDNVLTRAVADERLIDAARQCADAWHSLQELAGINNSHAMALLADAESAWQLEKESLLREAADRSAPDTAVPADKQAPPDADNLVTDDSSAEPGLEETTAVPSDQAWIETIRCTTCNECTDLNNRMFAYNDDMQAYIADPDAGSYRDLVLAAETCQVAIIHPGQPRNPDEPGLDELLSRAEPFM